VTPLPGARLLWLGWFVALLALAYVVPYTVLADFPRIYGAYLFWAVLALVAIVSMFSLISRWED